MSFVAHPGWATYSTHLQIERDKATGAITKIAFIGPPRAKAAAIKMRMNCIACERAINPIRRVNGRHLFVPFCPPRVRKSCSQNPSVGEEYARIDRLIAAKGSTP
jgi:hypothetical protein